jgi:hypothetical protein
VSHDFRRIDIQAIVDAARTHCAANDAVHRRLLRVRIDSAGDRDDAAVGADVDAPYPTIDRSFSSALARPERDRNP